MISIFVGLHY